VCSIKEFSIDFKERLEAQNLRKCLEEIKV